MSRATIQRQSRLDVRPKPAPAPGRQPAELDALSAFVASTRPWDRLQVPLSRRSTCALWGVGVGAGAVGSWLAAAAPCRGLVCSIATLGHPRVLLLLAALCVVTLLALAPVTGGLTRAGTAELGAITVASAAGVASLLGVVAVVVLAVLVTVLAIAAFALVVDQL